MQRIFITGLPGSGKSTVGRQAAKLLGWNFVDTDDLLAERSGLPVGQALLEHGEERFRQLETEALISAARQECIVIATGGGAVIAEVNRAFMQEHGLTVYLQVSIDTAWQRIQEHLCQAGTKVVRPLVDGTDGKQRLQGLYAARKRWYEEAALHIDTDGQKPEHAAQKVVAYALACGHLASSTLPRVSMRLRLGTTTSQALVEWGGLCNLPEALQSYEVPERVFIVTDSEVGRLYAEPITALLAGAGFSPSIFSVPAGESSKSFEYWQQIIDWLVEQRAEQQEALVALGGGVVGDLAGFVASSYRRGVPLIQVPTTLLAQVDAAIGGKAGINHPLGKNLVGAYYQPRLIFVDPAFLLTLPERVYREGWAEVVKYGMILDADLFRVLEEHTGLIRSRDPALLATIIARCIRLKMDVVQGDERDSGLRNILNYGHTFGHALEALTGYGSWLHGEAVSIGMEVAAQIAVKSGLLAAGEARRQRTLLQALDLPVCCPGVEPAAVLTAMRHDKKVRAGRTRWVLPTRTGQAQVYSDIDPAIVREVIAAVCSSESKMAKGEGQ